MTRVVNKYRDSYDVYIGRNSKWGNPFKIGIDGTREDVIEQYRDWIQTQSHLLNSLEELRGKTLGCFCSPQACHGDILVELLNNDNSRLRKPRDKV